MIAQRFDTTLRRLPIFHRGYDHGCKRLQALHLRHSAEPRRHGRQVTDAGILGPYAPVVLGLIAIGGFLLVGSTVVNGRTRDSIPSRLRTRFRLLKAHLRNRQSMRRVRNRLLKRSLDILIAVPLLVLLAPVLLGAIVLLWLTEGRPIFYVSTRYIGLDKPVRVIKLRTMVRDATSPKYRLRERFMRDGYLDIPIDCEVYTPVGRILERLQIVELPQLLNVLFDGMSLVGNRPLPRENLELLSRLPSWERRFDSPAGITGISQVVGKLALTPPERLRLESLYSRVYLEGNIVMCDWQIVWVTVSRVFLHNQGIPLERAEKLLGWHLPKP